MLSLQKMLSLARDEADKAEALNKEADTLQEIIEEAKGHKDILNQIANKGKKHVYFV